MIAWVVACLLVVAFVALLHAFRLPAKAREGAAMATRSFEIVRDRAMSDEEKERVLQRHALGLFRLAFQLTLGCAVAVFVPFAVLWVADHAGLVSLDAVLGVSFSWPFIVIAGVIALAAMALGSGKEGKGDARYSLLDRVLHRIAFATRPAQIAVADFEDRMFAGPMAKASGERPVFIAGMPRAGTTILLRCFNQSPEFATHLYRDMPFVLTPLLWDRFSGGFRRDTAPRERDHGDGIVIDQNSPEALEEVLWKAFWSKHYRRDRVAPWSGEADRDFRDFFRAHMRKIAVLRRPEGAGAARYVSKNNMNIARVATLRATFPDATILIPFRHPLDHAKSLLEQHENFLAIHRDDPFARRYMEAIGHYDFGENLRPIDFDRWLDARRTGEVTELAFWIEHWTAAYRHLLGQASFVRFVDYDAFCAEPRRVLEAIARYIEAGDPDSLIATAEGIRPARRREIDTSGIDSAILGEADETHRRLLEVSLRDA